MAVQHDRRMSSGVGNVLQPMLKESYVSPRPASRVGTSTDAAKYMRRNRGSSSLWLVKRCGSMDLGDNSDDELDSSRTGGQSVRAPRLTGDVASEIHSRSKGSVGVLLNESNQVGYTSPRPKPRLTSGEAEANACRKAEIFARPSERPSSRPRPRLVSAEAESNATRGAGTVSTLLKTDDRPRTSELKTWNKKSELSLCLDETSVGAEDDGTTRPRQRVKPEAEENARKNAGTCAAAIAGRLAGD